VSLPAGARVLAGVGGGDINQAFHVELADGREAFVKTRPDAAPGEYEAEAAGLRWLGEPGALRVPEVLELGEDYLAIEWIPRGGLGRDGEEELGRGLAATHDAGAPVFGLQGAPAAGGGQAGGAGGAGTTGAQPARFGSLGLPNEPTEDWATFYAERRLLPLARKAAETGALSSAGVGAVEDVAERMHELAGAPEPPARLHGDLWAGNVMGDEQGRPWLIDPSAFGGHREVDLAMLRLFGGPSERMFDAYDEAHPLTDGWRERVELYQLSPLLVHALLFGGSYRQAAERVASRYA
jgi:fructosamine-3-kinase